MAEIKNPTSFGEFSIDVDFKEAYAEIDKLQEKLEGIGFRIEGLSTAAMLNYSVMVKNLMDTAKEHGLDMEGEFCHILARIFPTPIEGINIAHTKADEVTTLLETAADCGIEKNADLFWRLMRHVYDNKPTYAFQSVPLGDEE